MMEPSSGEDPCCTEQRASSLDRIYRYLDGELDVSALTEIERHLATCNQCREDYTIESMLKELVRRSCCQDRAPDGLRERIRARILVERSAIGVRSTTVIRTTRIE